MKKSKAFRFHSIKFHVKTIMFVIICFLCFQNLRLTILVKENIKSRNSEHEFIKNSIFPESSMPDHEWWQLLWPDPKAVILSLGVEPNMVSLDLCCGYGHFTIPLAQSSLKIYALELDDKLLEKARKETLQKNIKNCIWIQGDAMNVDNLISEKVDFILLANTFHGVMDKKALGKNMYSILKPKGKLAILNWKKKPREETTLLGIPTGPESEVRMSSLEVDEILRPLGFALHKIIDFPPYHYGIVFTKETAID